MTSSPPNDLQRFLIVSALMTVFQQRAQGANDPAPEEGDHQHEKEAEEEIVFAGDQAQALLDQNEHGGADKRPKDRVRTADDDHQDAFTAGLPAHRVGVDEIGVLRLQDAGERANHCRTG